MINRILLFTLSILFLTACSTAPTSEPVVSRMQITEFSKKLSSTKDAQVLDVRTPEEVAGGTIPSAININFNGDDFDNGIGKLNKEKPIFVYCQGGVIGGRSDQTKTKLKDLGFQEIYELDGGYTAWAESQTIAEVLEVSAFANKLTTLENVQLIDVRTPKEVAGGSIENSINMNFYDDDFATQLGKLNKDQPVMVYCKAGGRSNKALNQLKTMGFKEVYDLAGGYTAWAKQK